MHAPKETPLKSVMRTITNSPTKNSPSKIALRMKVLKQTIAAPILKSPRIQAPKLPSPKYELGLKKISFNKEEVLKPESSSQSFESILKTRELPVLLKIFKYKQESIEKIMRFLEIFEIKDLKNAKELEKLKDLIEKELSSEDCVKYVLRNYFEKEGISEFENLVRFCQKGKIHLEDPSLKEKISKEKKGVELEVLNKEYANLEKFKHLFSEKNIGAR